MGFRQFVLQCLAVTYSRTLREYTLEPIEKMVKEEDPHHLRQAIVDWQGKKVRELGVVKVSSGIAAAATVAIFSWPEIASTVWVARSLWYWSLTLSVFAYLTLSQQETVIGELELPSESPCTEEHVHKAPIRVSTTNTQSDQDLLDKAKQTITRLTPLKHRGFSHYMMLYFWQCPSMLMSYAWVTFFAALTIHICQPIVPLAQHGIWTDQTRVMVFYIIAVGLGMLNFGLCSKISRGPGLFQNWMRSHASNRKSKGSSRNSLA